MGTGPGPSADLNHDCRVDLNDFALVTDGMGFLETLMNDWLACNDPTAANNPQ